MIPILFLLGGIFSIFHALTPKYEKPVPTYSEWYLKELEEKKEKARLAEQRLSEQKLAEQKKVEEIKKRARVVKTAPDWLYGTWASSRNQHNPIHPAGIIWKFSSSEVDGFNRFDITGELPSVNFDSNTTKNTFLIKNKKFIIYINEKLSYEFTLIDENRINYTPVFFGSDKRKYTLVKF